MDEAWTLSDLIHLLSQRVLDPADFVRCAVVCQVWRSCFVEYIPNAQVEPWLMLAERKESDVRDFYNLTDGKLLSVALPEARGMSCFNTSYGWVLTLGLDLGISLLHPLSRIQIPLPSANTFTEVEGEDNRYRLRKLLIAKVCLSSDPSEKNCVIMAIRTPCCVLSFTRLGDSSWTDVEYLYGKMFRDILFFKGRFYAIRCDGIVSYCDIDSSQPKAIPFARLPSRPDERPWDVFSLYLVESCGKILAVARYLDKRRRHRGLKLVSYRTCSFEVYQMEQDGQGSEKKWSRVMDLGDYALFLGRSLSTSICIKNSNGIRRNCIYFTDDCYDCYILSKVRGGRDAGVFCIDNGKIEHHYEGLSLSFYSPPAWLTFSPINLQ